MKVFAFLLIYSPVIFLVLWMARILWRHRQTRKQHAREIARLTKP